MTAAPLSLGLVVEGSSDARTMPQIVDRVLVAQVPINAEALDGVRAYRGLDAAKSCVLWRDLERISTQRRVPRRHGHFRGEPGVEDARNAVNALQCFVAENPQPAAVILVRDSDGKKDEREKGLEQARTERNWPFEVLVGIAHLMRENWVIGAFDPQDGDETAALTKLRAELGFNPAHRSELLDATNETAKKSPKRVLPLLTNDDHEREADCFREADIEHLRKTGAGNGLAAFVGEIEEKLVPLVRKLPRTAWEALDEDHF